MKGKKNDGANMIKIIFMRRNRNKNKGNIKQEKKIRWYIQKKEKQQETKA